MRRRYTPEQAIAPRLTPDKTLCTQCTHAAVATGHRQNERRVSCEYFRSDITFNVAKCTEFFDRQDISQRQMRDIAWMIVSDSKQRIGFKTPAEYRQLEDEGKV